MAVNERFDFSDCRVLITGGGKGIGKVYVEEFAKAGARVAAADIDVAAAESVAASLTKAGLEVFGLGVDIADEAVRQSGGRVRAGPSWFNRRARQQCIADEHVAAALLARNPDRGMGPGHGGQSARHVSCAAAPSSRP